MSDIPGLELKPRAVEKSAAAYRTIGEVSTELGVPQHVLRFWEAKFPQIKPLKRGGGRRYYRPEDVDLLRRIESLLYRQGYTIKGVQRLLADTGRADPPQEVLPLDLAEAEVPVGGGDWDDKKAALQAVLEELVQVQRLLRKS